MTGQPLDAAFHFALWVLPGIAFNVACLALVLAPTAIRHLIREARIRRGMRRFELHITDPAVIARYRGEEKP